MEAFKEHYERARSMAEEELQRCFTQELPQKGLLEAMNYSLLAGGKRIRPVLALTFCEAVCGAMEPALDYACAVEMVHTYSLIHDDLPCMDNDDLRRGKPTCHKVYGEWMAILAGDALQAEAFAKLSSSTRTSGPASNSRACGILAQAAGALHGICGGQYLDMIGEGSPKSPEELIQIHSLKTAALLKAACLLGLAASFVDPTPDQWQGAELYAQELGMAFQIRDDMLDELSTTQELGKPVGSDAEQGKYTFATLYGMDRCQDLVLAHTQRAKQAVETVFPNSEFLCALADELAGRTH